MARGVEEIEVDFERGDGVGLRAFGFQKKIAIGGVAPADAGGGPGLDVVLVEGEGDHFEVFFQGRAGRLLKLVAIVLGGATIVIGIGDAVLVAQILLEAASLALDLAGVVQIDEEAEGFGSHFGRAIKGGPEFDFGDEVLIVIVNGLR